MTDKREHLAGMSANGAAAYAMNNDLGELFEEPPDQLGELVRHLDAARQAAASLKRDAA